MATVDNTVSAPTTPGHLNAFKDCKLVYYILAEQSLVLWRKKEDQLWYCSYSKPYAEQIIFPPNFDPDTRAAIVGTVSKALSDLETAVPFLVNQRLWETLNDDMPTNVGITTCELSIHVPVGKTIPHELLFKIPDFYEDEFTDIKEAGRQPSAFEMLLSRCLFRTGHCWEELTKQPEAVFTCEEAAALAVLLGHYLTAGLQTVEPKGRKFLFEILAKLNRALKCFNGV